ARSEDGAVSGGRALGPYIRKRRGCRRGCIYSSVANSNTRAGRGCQGITGWRVLRAWAWAWARAGGGARAGARGDAERQLTPRRGERGGWEAQRGVLGLWRGGDFAAYSGLLRCGGLLWASQSS